MMLAAVREGTQLIHILNKIDKIEENFLKTIYKYIKDKILNNLYIDFSCNKVYSKIRDK